MQTILKAISEDCRVNITRYEKVQGGDINESYCLQSTGNKYFLKLNDADRLPHMFEREAEGLEALRVNSTIVIPGVIKHGIINDRQWLLLEWIEKGAVKKESLQNFGAKLAQMHRTPQPYFGWHNNNYIGSLLQTNTQYDNWAEFYIQCRLMPLIKLLFDADTFTKQEMTIAELASKRIAVSFPNEPPALLHGDLWAGNYTITATGDAVFFDPAVYFGHREMDIGMTQLFGGFDNAFYNAYQEVYPLENGWQQRLSLTQLYPLLVHAVLFGGHYIPRVKDILKTWKVF
jgi:fructosamine-3-kinase